MNSWIAPSLKLIDETKDIPIIFNTSANLSEEERRRLAPGTAAILSKSGGTVEEASATIRDALIRAGLRLTPSGHGALHMAGLPPETVLIIDDDEAKRHAIAKILRKAGYAIREGATGGEGLRLAAEKPILIILDVKLPDVSGFEVCRRIKEDPATSRNPCPAYLHDLR